MFVSKHIIIIKRHKLVAIINLEEIRYVYNWIISGKDDSKSYIRPTSLTLSDDKNFKSCNLKFIQLKPVAFMTES